MRTPLVAGNWKMNHLASDAIRFGKEMSAASSFFDQVEVALFPPSTLLMVLGRILEGSGVLLGGQSCHHERSGAFTGEISAPMLADAGCELVLAGHSERRALFGETDDIVARKLAAIVGAGLVPVLCVGELEDERESGRTRAVIERQLGALDGIASAFDSGSAPLVLAYEPVWAIGTGRTASPEQAQEVHGWLRDILRSRVGEAGRDVRILYGGSVNPGNFERLLAQPDVDGGLVGGASLDPETFLSLVRIAAPNEEGDET